MSNFDKLAESLNRSKLLMKVTDRIPRGQMDESKYNSSLYDDINSFTSVNEGSLSKTVNKQIINSSPLQVNKNMSNKGLPKEIYESFMENPLNNTNDLSTSFLDEMLSNGKLKYQEDSTIEEKTNIEENISKENLNTSSSQTFDYSILKLIIEDAIDRKLNEYKKTLLNESNSNKQILSTIGIRNGKLTFLSSNGDLYEAELKFVKNVKSKKQS